MIILNYVFTFNRFNLVLSRQPFLTIHSIDRIDISVLMIFKIISTGVQSWSFTFSVTSSQVTHDWLFILSHMNRIIVVPTNPSVGFSSNSNNPSKQKDAMEKGHDSLNKDTVTLVLLFSIQLLQLCPIYYVDFNCNYGFESQCQYSVIKFAVNEL